jgi:hypothetical protein
VTDKNSDRKRNLIVKELSKANGEIAIEETKIPIKKKQITTL